MIGNIRMWCWTVRLCI